MRARLLLGVFASTVAVSALRGQLYNDYAFYTQGDDAPYTTQWELNPEHPPGPPPKEPDHGFPHFPGKPKEPNGTVYTVLSESPIFSRFFKAVNFSDEIVSLLNDSSKSVSLFALPNHAIPKRPPHRKETNELHIGDWLSSDFGLPDLVTHIEALDADALSRPSKEHLKKIVTAILSYHILPEKHTFKDLTDNVTHATSLSHVFGGLNDEPLRLRVGRAFPIGLTVNGYSRVIGLPLHATNGIIYSVNHPLFPPPSAFQEFFLLQRGFSTLTSAIQRTGLTDLIDYRVVRDASTMEITTEGAPVVTIFAPSNAAFEKLPLKLKLFLFSPFGEHVLKAILQYHVIPTTAIHSDWLLNTTSEFSINDFNIADLDPSCMEELVYPDGARPADGHWTPAFAKHTKEWGRDKRAWCTWSRQHEARHEPSNFHNSDSYWKESFSSPPVSEGYDSYNSDPYYNEYDQYNSGPYHGPHPSDHFHSPPPHFYGPPPHHYHGPPPPHFHGPPPPHFHGPPPPHFHGPPPPHFHGPHPPPPFYGPHPPPFFHGPHPPPHFHGPPSPQYHYGAPHGHGPHSPPPRFHGEEHQASCPPQQPLYTVPRASYVPRSEAYDAPPSEYEEFSFPPPSRPPPPHFPPHSPPHFPPHSPGGGKCTPPPGSPPNKHLPKIEVAANYTVATALTGKSVNVLVIKVPIIPPGHKGEIAHITKVIVNGQPAKFNDGVALNGAIHVVDKLVSPRRKTHPSPPRQGMPVSGEDFDASSEEEADDWEDWEDWLLEWARQ